MGLNLREIEVESYRRLLGIVEQDVFLFDGTIAENIAYGDRWATRAQIEQAARVANAAEFIDRLPDGYNTLIGERGVRLSGGQRQRLAIARAILADPKVFILDEATSNLDSESERLIQQSLDQLLRGRTSFVIAHRLSTIRHADRILVLDDGAIAQAGSHDELMAGSGLYRDMVELQRIEQGDSAELNEPSTMSHVHSREASTRAKHRPSTKQKWPGGRTARPSPAEHGLNQKRFNTDRS